MLFPMVACTLTFQIPPALELKISYVGIFPNFPWRWISPIPTARDFPNSRGAGFSEIPWGYISKFPWRWMSQTAVASYLSKFTWPRICQILVALDLQNLHPRADWGPRGPTHDGKGGIVVGYRFHVVFTSFRGILPKSHILHKWVVIHSVRGP